MGKVTQYSVQLSLGKWPLAHYLTVYYQLNIPNRFCGIATNCVVKYLQPGTTANMPNTNFRSIRLPQPHRLHRLLLHLLELLLLLPQLLDLLLLPQLLDLLLLLPGLLLLLLLLPDLLLLLLFLLDLLLLLLLLPDLLLVLLQLPVLLPLLVLLLLLPLLLLLQPVSEITRRAIC
jgi:hypothetical protein